MDLPTIPQAPAKIHQGLPQKALLPRLRRMSIREQLLQRELAVQRTSTKEAVEGFGDADLHFGREATAFAGPLHCLVSQRL